MIKKEMLFNVKLTFIHSYIYFFIYQFFLLKTMDDPSEDIIKNLSKKIDILTEEKKSFTI